MRRRRKKLKIVPVFLTLLFLMVIAGGVLYGPKLLKELKKEEPKPVEPTPPPKKDPVVTSLTMVMVGDALIHSSVYNDANRLANWSGYDFKPQISIIKDYIKDYDIKYYNQETILGGTSIGVSDYPTFNTPQEFGRDMIDAGFNLVSLATNHTVDRGKTAVLNSREFWNRDREEEVQAVGSYSSSIEKQEIESRVLEKNGIKYAMLNYTYGTNGMPVSDDYLVNVWPTDLKINDPSRDTNYQEYKKQVKKDIEAVRDQVDVLLVAMHWGVEYTHEPTAYEKDSAKFLA